MNKQGRNYYFPKLLKGQLAQILNYPLTLVEAPSGFGKTTAVKEHLEEPPYQAINIYWYTCLGEPAYKAWDCICSLLDSVDESTFRKMKSMGLPSKDTLYDMIALMRGIHCEEQTVLVIDNYQLIRNAYLDMLSNAFLSDFNCNFHIVIITQPQKKKITSSTVYNSQKLLIDRSYFFFSKEDTNCFFKQSGIRLSCDELDHIWQSTEGWIAALSLQKKNYQSKGCFGDAVGIEGLLETAIWNRMSVEEQDFLLSLSLFDRFTLRQAMIMLNTDTLPEYANNLLIHNDFIRFDMNSHSYFFHSLLHDYLIKRLEQRKATEYARCIYLRAGAAYAAVSQNYNAAQCYYEIGDFDRLLSLPFKCNEMDEWVGMGSDVFVSNILKKCPRTVLLNYPKCLLVFAFEMFLLGKYELFGELCGVLSEILTEDNDRLCEGEYEWLSGEFALMMSMVKFNDIEQMSKEQRRAYGLLGGAARILTFTDGWTMDAPSVLYLFWRESGALQQELLCIDECMPYYHKVTNDHGMGAEIVMKAEALLYAGDDVEAEVLCHKALYLADMKDQSSICFCAEMCLLRIAILRGDTSLFESVIANIDKRTLTGYLLRSRYTQALVKGFVFVQLDSTDAIESWLLESLEFERLLYSVAVPFGQIVYAGYLIASEQYAKLIGVSELLIGRAEEQHLLLAKVYQLIYLSIALLRSNQREKAAKQLTTALELALPDKVYLPFAENAKLLGGFLDAVCIAQYGHTIEKIHRIAHRQNTGVEKINREILCRDSGLTPREKEIALLAQNGKTNKEIGALLFVSPETVKMTLKKIFKKLGIHSRVQLEAATLK
ncbi:MAG: LuxR C-terminal-related transcriptional regulator [Angelakisella sp.]